MEKLINIGTVNGVPHFASFRVDRDCFGRIDKKELYSVRSGDMEYIQKYGITKCIPYASFESMRIDMTDVYKNCVFTWDNTEYFEMLENNNN